MKPLHMVLRDLERASLKGELTPTFIDHYASRHGERAPALYALAQKNGIVVNIEEGRNDHLLKEWSGGVDMDAMSRAMERQAVETYRKVRNAREDGRPAVLRKPATRWAAYVVKPEAEGKAHRCPPGCTCDLD
jgi:hypothetical protein